MGLASALGGLKNAKNAKNAKSANPWKLAFLPSGHGTPAVPGAVLGRAGDPIVAEPGGYTTGCGRDGALPASRCSSAFVRGSKPLPFAVSAPPLFHL